ncbi:pantetheinase-like isoform X2 [Mya arenaria]|uniref:pantetheinase-like isoform X2 n=1 Tax=Mya arenaria TaxID=6604 RepID=UPI0022E37A18|nr:pantetheinase-like isoform X2 [Mya arenaria]
MLFVLVLCLVLIGDSTTDADIVPRCPEIRAENGKVNYSGDKERYTSAHISCDEGYSVGKDGVETVACLHSLQWENTLQCYKTVKPWKPANSKIRKLEDDDVEHHETYTLRCNKGYEMKQMNGRYLGEEDRSMLSVSVQNLNGVLKYGEIDATLLSCVEKRCFQKAVRPSKYHMLIIQPKRTYVEHGQSFILSCENGFVHNLTSDPNLLCTFGKLSRIKHVCAPLNCKFDRPIEQGMTLKHRGKFIKASSKKAIDHGESVKFNCKYGGNGVRYEPKKRLFKCDRGKWLEDNSRGGSWSLGNNGTFPECRPAKCECQNGGTCIRDKTCRCSRFTKGLQCETPDCPNGCLNGGTCTFPNQCSCPVGFTGSRCQKSRKTYMAAVYEHALVLPSRTLVPVSRQTAVENMMVNLRVYQHQAKIAATQNADIIVFPEDGVYGVYMDDQHEIVYPYLELIPDPTKLQSNPCNNPSTLPDTEVQQVLSCIAKENKLFVVANIGDKVPCNQNDTKCPGTGHYQYNTNVVYDPQGTLVARYHKYNLYGEYQFDRPEHADIAVFETPFGRFGTFTCFDILFEHPAIDLITKHNVTNIVFPTAWMDAAPFFNSIQFHSAFAAAHGINHLASNIHFPQYRFHGSGIYTPEGAAAYYYNTTVGSEGRLLVKEIPVVHEAKTLSLPFEEHATEFTPSQQGEYFSTVIFKNKYNATPLTGRSGRAVVCHNNLCCHASYKTNETSVQSGHESDGMENEYFALGAFDGLRYSRINYYIQVCIILRCHDNGTTPTCNDKVNLPVKIDMLNFEMSGNFSTPYIYPEILLQKKGDFGLASYPKRWSYADGRLKSDNKFMHPLAVATLLGRSYDRD